MKPPKPAKEELYLLYMINKFSPEHIGLLFSVSGRTIRTWMNEYNIDRLGNNHLRKGVSATWNIGIIRSEETKAKLSTALTGKKSHNFGKGRQKFNCKVCDKEVFDKPYRLRRTCSKECRGRLRGEDHWNFNGGLISSQRKRYWAEYKIWRKKVIENGRYICDACQKIGGKLTAHHLYGWRTHPELALKEENGKCLCWGCHLQFHKDVSFKEVTPEDYKIWAAKKKQERHDATDLC